MGCVETPYGFITTSPLMVNGIPECSLKIQETMAAYVHITVMKYEPLTFATKYFTKYFRGK